MSYQAITDFLVNPIQLQQDYQNFQPNKDTFSVQSSSSFEDLVSFYKEMNEPPAQESPKAETPVQEKTPENKTETVKSENADEKTAKTDEKVTVNSEKVEISEEKPAAEEVKLAKNDLSLKNASNLAEKDEPKVVVQKDNSSEKKAGPEKKVDSGKKKLASKEYARMEQYTDAKTAESGALAASKEVKNLPSKVEVEDKNEKTKTITEVVDNKTNSESLALKKFAEDAQNQNSRENFSNETKGSEDKKVLTLDKEGKITVEDLRTEKTFAQELEAESLNEKKTSLKVSDLKMTDSNTVEMTMNVAENAQSDVLSLNNQTASANGSNFQAMLSNQIQTNASEFVKAGNIVLNDNNQGTINLVLHPDDLGNVKVHLSLDGKTMSAQIVVSSKEALQVFKENSETLREAFIKGGFDVADFEVAYNDGGSFNQNMEFGGQQEQNNYVAQRVYNSVAGGAVSDFESDVQKNDEFSNYSINIVA